MQNFEQVLFEKHWLDSKILNCKRKVPSMANGFMDCISSKTL